MKRPVTTLLCLLLLFGFSLAAFAPANAAGDAANGMAQYQTRCAACHSLDFNGLGPSHRGVYGRRAGAVKDFNYSSALKASGLVWNEASLESWLADPEKSIPGQRMGINVPEANVRADIIAFLKRIPTKTE